MLTRENEQVFIREFYGRTIPKLTECRIFLLFKGNTLYIESTIESQGSHRTDMLKRKLPSPNFKAIRRQRDGIVKRIREFKQSFKGE